MKEVRLAELLGEVREDLVRDALPPKQKRKYPWKPIFTLAACLALVLAVGSVLPAFLPKGATKAEPPMAADAPAAAAPMEDVPAEAPMEDEPTAEEPGEGYDMMPHVTVDGKVYLISSHLSSYDDCPEGFTLGGVLEGGDFDGCSYYTSEEHPQLVYVYSETNNRGEVDSTGTVIATEWHMAYLRFASEEMRGKDFVCVDGQLYTSMWNGWGAVDAEFYDRIETTYGIRMEGDAPEGFVSRGCAEFVGWDIWPTGSLSSNTGEEEIYVNPAKPEIVLVAATWQNVSGVHSGFDVYLRYEKEPTG